MEVIVFILSQLYLRDSLLWIITDSEMRKNQLATIS